MLASHPPSLITLVRRTLKDECQLERGSHLLLGVSGGPDSMALLHALAQLRRSLGFVLSAHGVNHGLRREAGAELALAARFASELRVPFATTELGLLDGGNLQARARQARYRVLREQAARAGADFIATAHHALDRAETVLLRLLRGTGVRGLGVLPARSQDLLRPMLRALPADVENHLARHAIPCSRDPSNREARFLRVRVRHELLPLLEQLSPQIVKHLTGLADQVIVGDRATIDDEAGTRVPLGRAQALQLAKMLKAPTATASVALGAGRVIRLDPGTGQPRLTFPAGSARQLRRRQKS